MPFSIVRNDIAAMRTDCIVCPTDPYYSGWGGADFSIHRAAGPRLDEVCRSLPPLAVGDVAVTEGFDLPVRYILHTEGPVWIDGNHMEEESLSNCYNAVLQKAADLGMESIAIPLISSGTFGFPKDRVLRIALDAVNGFLLDHDMAVYIVVYDKSSYAVSKKLISDIESFIDDSFISRRDDSYSSTSYYQRPRRTGLNRRPDREEFFSGQSESVKPSQPLTETFKQELPKPSELEEDHEFPESSVVFSYKTSDLDAEILSHEALPRKPDVLPSKKFSKKDYSRIGVDELRDIIKKPDEGFSVTLLKLIDEKRMTDVDCYKKANIDKKLFSKIRSNPSYRPSKPTVLAFAIALELNIEETASLLEKAGYALSPSYTFDQIIRYFIEHHYYDILEINMVLFSFDQPCLGNVVA